MKNINAPIRKKDAMALVTGKPVYTDDIVPKDALVVKLLRSPHAHAIIEEINIDIAKKLPGIEGVFTYKDVSQKRFTLAGQSFPEPSPYDRLVLDKHLRFVGDPVAIIAGVDEKSILRAMKTIKVKYKVLDPILDLRTAKDNNIIIHPEDSWSALGFMGADNKRNLAGSGSQEYGNTEEEFKNSDVIIERTYHTKANQQAAMETFRAYASLDTYGRLNITSSTQVPFHVRRVVSHALDISKSKVRVIKPRIGGGFGSKQTVVCEMYPAFVTWMTGKPSKLIYTREENQLDSSPRHEMEISVKIGAKKSGEILAIHMKTLSNTGAYGEHGFTTARPSGQKSLPMYSRAKSAKFDFDVVYTNKMSAGAFRGYGATQGIFAMECIIDELAHELEMDPSLLREKNIVREGDLMRAYHDEVANSCALDRCLEKAKSMIGWDEKGLTRLMPNGKVRGLGIGLGMQGSGVFNIDVGSTTLKINDDGFYALMIGAADMGTGCDTILSQIVAEVLECSVDNIIVHGVDTDASPYDSGSYASSTTYLTGMAAYRTADTLREKIIEFGANILGIEKDKADFNGSFVFSIEDEEVKISIKDIGNKSTVNNKTALDVTESHSSPFSPPPFMAGIAEVEVDTETGKVDLINYKAVVDCGTVINSNLCRVQAEGGIVQGIGMALFEDVLYNEAGKLQTQSLMTYKIPNRCDIGEIEVEFETSHEPTGPFGAKSIGEVVINTSSPAIANAVYNAVGVRIRSLPITPEKVLVGILDKEENL